MSAFLKRLRRWLKWPLRGLLACIALGLAYAAASALGARIPVNRGADPLEGTIDIYLVSNGVHVDLWLPAQDPARDWPAWFEGDLWVPSTGYVGLGWGDRGFFLDTPTWDDLTVGTALHAVFWPSATAMHVTPYSGPPAESDDVHLLRVSSEAYARLVDFLDRSFARDAAGRPKRIDHPGYYGSDRFFEGSGSYHLFRTCNVWTNDAVKALGKEAGLWTPFEGGARRHLPRNRGRA
ncbi:MAG: TIGR02117 family protein [Planctomycetota bacterium]